MDWARKQADSRNDSEQGERGDTSAPREAAQWLSFSVPQVARTPDRDEGRRTPEARGPQERQEEGIEFAWMVG